MLQYFRPAIFNPRFYLTLLSCFLFACQNGKKEPEYKTVPTEKMMANSYLENVDPNSLVSVTDTICGMSLIEGVADTLHYGTSIYGFCSSGCKKKFKKSLVSK